MEGKELCSGLKVIVYCNFFLCQSKIHAQVAGFSIEFLFLHVSVANWWTNRLLSTTAFCVSGAPLSTSCPRRCNPYSRENISTICTVKRKFSFTILDLYCHWKIVQNCWINGPCHRHSCETLQSIYRNIHYSGRDSLTFWTPRDLPREFLKVSKDHSAFSSYPLSRT